MPKADNAIIMAAGMANRFVPLSYEQPKGLLRVKGEVLIEREITQLQEAGIYDITLVVGYMKEKFFYLKEKYGVDIVVNEDYYRYNNTSTLMCVLDRLSNTYICSSDNYFSENVFTRQVPYSYYAAVYGEGKTKEYCLETDGEGIIKKVAIGGHDAWYMLGHAFFAKEFSEKFKQILVKEYENSITKEHLWEDLYIRYIDELKLHIKKYAKDMIYEFDTLEELREFDETYKVYSGSKIMDTIRKCFGCHEVDISNIKSLDGGMTNRNFTFVCGGDRYVYRYPGEGTEQLINRKEEKISTKLASELGIDTKLIYFDENSGVKITPYIKGARTMSKETFHENENIRSAAKVLYKLHHCKQNTGISFDVFGMAAKYEEYIKQNKGTFFEDYEEIKKKVYKIKEEMGCEGIQTVPCHNDPMCANWVKGTEGMFLIDWEYAGMNDAMWDLADFSIEADLTNELETFLLNTYFDRESTENEKIRFTANKVFIDFLWTLWGKTRVPFEGEWMERYAMERYDRLKQNLEQIKYKR